MDSLLKIINIKKYLIEWKSAYKLQEETHKSKLRLKVKNEIGRQCPCNWQNGLSLKSKELYF